MVCEFRWSDLSIPKWISQLAPSPVSTHLFLEYFDETWKVLDATWDRWLFPVFLVNRWRSSMSVAVTPVAQWTLLRSQRYAELMANQRTVITIERHLPFFRATNAWLEEVRRTHLRRVA